MAKILIVEDEKEISDLLVMNLKLVGHSCKQAFDGNEANPFCCSGSRIWRCWM